jgi:hypothetical protein
MNYANAKYGTNTQTQANANECDTGSNCAITSPQTQGDGTANSPTNLQISKFNQKEEEPPVGFDRLQFPVTLVACRFQDGVSCLVQEPRFFKGWIITCPGFQGIDCTFSTAGPPRRSIVLGCTQPSGTTTREQIIQCSVPFQNCEQCFRNFLTVEQISIVLTSLQTTLESLCHGGVISQTALVNALNRASVDVFIISLILDCLLHSQPPFL